MSHNIEQINFTLYNEAIYKVLPVENLDNYIVNMEPQFQNIFQDNVFDCIFISAHYNSVSHISEQGIASPAKFIPTAPLWLEYECTAFSITGIVYKSKMSISSIYILNFPCSRIEPLAK
ncbi:MAG: hypothetical protein QXD11_01215 [Candidatus Micrarchaeaceae archaeon]